jgi:hypothetical protein
VSDKLQFVVVELRLLPVRQRRKTEEPGQVIVSVISKPDCVEKVSAGDGTS